MLGSDVSTEIKDTGSVSNGESPQTLRRTRHLGFAVGTSRLVIARENADGYQYATQRNSYLSLPHQNLTHRTLEALHIPAIAKNGRLLVYGNEAETLAELFRADAHRPLKHGLFNPDEPESEEHLLRIIASLAGTGLTEDTRVCFTIPSTPLADSELIRYQSAALLRLAARLGVKACCLDEGLAVAYAELKDSNYTGLAISFGAGVTNVCLCYLSVPVLTFSLREGGDRIEEIPFASPASPFCASVNSRNRASGSRRAAPCRTPRPSAAAACSVSITRK